MTTSQWWSETISNVLVYSIYGACILVAICMARLSAVTNKGVARQKVASVEPYSCTCPNCDESVDVALMEAEAHRHELEADWPQYVIQEQP